MIYTTDKDELRPQITETIFENGGRLLFFGTREASLEEVLLQVVGEGNRFD